MLPIIFPKHAHNYEIHIYGARHLEYIFPCLKSLSQFIHTSIISRKHKQIKFCFFFFAQKTAISLDIIHQIYYNDLMLRKKPLKELFLNKSI